MTVPTAIAQTPPRPHLLTIYPMTRMGGTAQLRLNKAALQGQVVVLSRMVAPVFRRLVLHRAGDVTLVVAPRHVVDVVHKVAALALHLDVGGRGGSTSQRLTTRSVAQAPNARTISELRRLAHFTKGEFPDIAHNDDPVSFVEYAYSVKITQPNAPETFQKAMKLLDSELWRAAAKKEMDSLEDLQVYKLVPRSTVPPGTRVYKSRWVFKVKADNPHKAHLVVGGWGQVPGKDCSNTYTPVCRFQSVRMVWLSPQRWN